MLIKLIFILSIAVGIVAFGLINLDMSYTDPMFVVKYLPYEIVLAITSITLWYLLLRKEVPIYFSKELHKTLLISLPLVLIPTVLVVSVVINNKEIDYGIFSTILQTTIAVGISEEMLFRSIALGTFLSLKLTPKNSILLSASIFSLFHLSNLLAEMPYITMGMQLVNAFMMGVVFGYIYYKTRNIIYVMLIHFMWDFSLFINNMYGSVKEVGALMLLMVIGYFIWAIRDTFKLTKGKI